MLTEEDTELTSQKLFAESEKYVPGGVHSPAHAFKSVGVPPIVVTKANGPYIYTAEGTQLIDFVGAWGPLIFGHNHPSIKESITEALEYGTGYGTANRYAIALCEKIISALPSIEKIRMVSSGTEATMSAIRVARAFTKKNKIIKFAGCYHGHADYFLIKAGSGALTNGYPDSAGVPMAYARETIIANFNDLSQLRNIFEENSEDIAAVILEPYVGNCGFIPPEPGFLKTLRKLCTENDALLIFDEVMTGFRLALGGAQAIEDIDPDMTTLGKIIGGGLPVGAFGGKAEIMDLLAPIGPVYQAGTFSGNPLSMAAGWKALHMLEVLNPYKDLEAMGELLKTSLLEAAHKKGVPLQVPQKGSMFSIFFSDQPIKNYEDALKTDHQLFKKVFRYALDNGVFLAPSPWETCFISFAHKGSAIQKAIDVLCKAIKLL